MTKIKDLKNQPENNFNIIEILELVCPEGKIKYIETLLRVMKKTKNFNNYIESTFSGILNLSFFL